MLISPWVELDFFDKENLPYDESKKDHDYGPNICKTNFSTSWVRRKKTYLKMDLENTWENTFVVVGQDEVLGQSIRDTFLNKEKIKKKKTKKKHIFTVLASFTNRIVRHSKVRSGRHVPYFM